MQKKDARLVPVFLKIMVCLFLFSAVHPVFSEHRIALSDFLVHSDNPRYNYLGKGISEMIAVELAKSPGVVLVEREKRMELMDEMKFSLSGFADDTSQQLDFGRMLSADYLVFGEIVDMAPQLLISVRVTSIESGSVVYRDTLTEKAGSYEYISGFFASAILDHFEIEVAESTELKTEKKQEKDAEAVVAFSRAIEAYDRDDTEAAKKELKYAKRIDPEYEAASVYLNKLESISPKFRVETDYYAPTVNPAYLGFLQEDTVYFWSGNSIPPPQADEVNYQKVDDYYFKEYPNTQRAGYFFPVNSRSGIGIEYTYSYLENWINAPFTYDVSGTLVNDSKDQRDDYGTSLSAGYLLNDTISLGARVHTAFSSPHTGGTLNVAEEEFSYGAALGCVWAPSVGRYIFDMQASWASQKDWYLDEDNQELKSGSLPVIIDTTFITSLLDNRLTGAFKSIGDIYTDSQGGYALRAIPMLEYWVFPFLSLRGGYEYVHLQQSGTFAMGHGFLAGMSVRVWKLSLHFNYTLRKKPSRQVPGYLIDESYLLIGVTYTPGLFSR